MTKNAIIVVLALLLTLLIADMILVHRASCAATRVNLLLTQRRYREVADLVARDDRDRAAVETYLRSNWPDGPPYAYVTAPGLVDFVLGRWRIDQDPDDLGFTISFGLFSCGFTRSSHG